MNKKTAALLFLGVCIVLALLLLAKVITPIVSGLIFAIALVLFGALSRGFTKKMRIENNEYSQGYSERPSDKATIE